MNALPEKAAASHDAVISAIEGSTVSAAEAIEIEIKNRINAEIAKAADLADGGRKANEAADALEKSGVFDLIAKLSPFSQASTAKVIAKMTGIPLSDVKKRIAATSPTPAATIREIGDRPRVGGAISFTSEAAVAVPIVVEANGLEHDEVYIAIGGRRRVVARPDVAAKILGVSFSTVPSAATLAHRWRGWSEWAAMAPAPAWDEAFEAVRAALVKHVEFVRAVDADLVTCWIIATYLHPLCVAFPFLHFYGDPGSGKSQALAVLARLAFNAEKIIEISDAQLYRLVEECASTLLFDEADRLSSKDKEAQRTLLLGAFDRGNTVILSDVEDAKTGAFISRRFSIYSPRAFCTMKNMPTWAMTDRSIQVVMLRALGKQSREVVTDESADWVRIRDLLYRITLDRWREFAEAYASARAGAPPNRTGLRWAPILAVADLGTGGVNSETFRRLLGRMAEDEVEHVGEDPLREAVILGLWTLVRGEPTGLIEDVDENGHRIKRPTWAGAGDAAGADDVIEILPSAIYAAADRFLPPIPVDKKTGEPDAKRLEGRRRAIGGILRKLGIRPAVRPDGRAKRPRHGRERLKVVTRRQVADLLRRWPDLDVDVPTEGFGRDGEADDVGEMGVTQGGDADECHPESVVLAATADQGELL